MKTIHFFALLLTANLFLACTVEGQNWNGNGITGEGSLVTETLKLSSFDAIGLSINADVYLSQGPQSVRIEAQRNILNNIKKEVENGRWKIKFDKNVRKHQPIKIWISIPELTSVAVSGSGDVEGKSKFTGVGALKLAVSGSGNITLDADSRSVSAAISGSGDMELGGSTGDVEIAISGSGDVEAHDLKASDCSVKIAGSGDATVHVSGDLDVKIAGSGDVSYKGNPRVRSKISGSGDVNSM
ncbi:MAG: head GIN domain-containing protein [Bacteroidota bacterium]